MIRTIITKQALFVVVFLATISSSLAQKQEGNYIRFEVKDREEISTVTRLVSIDNYKNDTVYAFATDAQLEQFKAKTSYTFEFYQPDYDVKAKVINMAGSVSEMANWDRYPTYDVYVQMMNDFAANYPEICTVESIGNTVEGRELLVAKISDNVNTEEDEPEFFYTSTMHGDETTGYVLMLRLIDTLLTSYNSNPEIKNLVDNIEIYINPNANPDGSYAGGNSTVSGASRTNANGVDINRDFPDPIDGPNTPWQPETQAMMNFAEDNNIVLSANFHGGAEVANYPWDGTYRAHVDESWLKMISLVYANSAINNSPSGYFKSITSSGVTNGADWYQIYGGRQDYMTYFHHGREVTMEISDVKLLSTDQLPALWEYNREALFLYMQECLYGIRGIVTDTLNNLLDARIKILGHDAEEDSSYVYTDPDVGDYHRMIDSGTYDVEFYAEGYNRDTVFDVRVDHEKSVRIDVKLKQEPVLSVSPAVISNYIIRDSVKTQLLKLENIGVDTLDYSISVDNPQENGWLSLSLQQGSIVKNTDSLYLTFDATGLETGIYNTVITIDYNMGKSFSIPVELIVNSSEIFSYQPDTFNVSISRFESTTETLTISNDNLYASEYFLLLEDSTFKDNLKIKKAVDSIEGQSAREVQFDINPAGLSPGKHRINMVLTDSVDYINKIPVNLEVLYVPAIEILVDSVSLTLEQGQNDSVYFSMVNNSKDKLGLGITEDLENYSWIQLPGLDSLPGEDTIQIKIRFLTENVEAGHYSLTLGFSQQLDDSLVYLPVEYTVTTIEEVTTLDDMAGKRKIRCYPNPFKERVKLVADFKESPGDMNVQAFDNTGRLLQTFSFTDLRSGRNELNLQFDRNKIKSHHIIYLRINTEKRTYIQKLIHLE